MKRSTMLVACLAMLACLFVAACGSDDNESEDGVTAEGGVKLEEPTEATLILDFLPGGVHAGIYHAVVAGYYEDNNLDLRIIPPTSTSDPLKLIESGRADIGIADGVNVASLLAKGEPVRGIMALVERPLAGIITRKADGYKSPADLDDKTLGITGDPSDEPITRWIVENGGGNYDSLDVVTIGFNGVTNLESGKVDAFTGFYPADGVQVQLDGTPTTIFKLDEFGAPSYPGLVVFSTEQTIEEEPGVMQAFVDATIRGYEDTLNDPELSLDDLIAENPGLDERVAGAQLKAYLPLFQGSAPSYGVLEPSVIEEFGQWAVEAGVLEEPFTFEEFGTDAFVSSE